MTSKILIFLRYHTAYILKLSISPLFYIVFYLAPSIPFKFGNHFSRPFHFRLNKSLRLPLPLMMQLEAFMEIRLIKSTACYSLHSLAYIYNDSRSTTSSPGSSMPWEKFVLLSQAPQSVRIWLRLDRYMSVSTIPPIRFLITFPDRVVHPDIKKTDIMLKK